MAKRQQDFGTFQDPNDKDRVVVAPTIDDAVRMRHDGWAEVVPETSTRSTE